MYSKSILLNLNCFSKLLEQLHICSKGGHSILETPTDNSDYIVFNCCISRINLDSYLGIILSSSSPNFTEEFEESNTDQLDDSNKLQSVFNKEIINDQKNYCTSYIDEDSKTSNIYFEEVANREDSECSSQTAELEEFDSVFINEDGADSICQNDGSVSRSDPALSSGTSGTTEIPESTSATSTHTTTDPLLIEPKGASSTQAKGGTALPGAKWMNSGVVSARNIHPKVVQWYWVGNEQSKVSIRSKQKIVKSKTAKKKEKIDKSDEVKPRKKRSLKYPSELVCEFCGLCFKGMERMYKFSHHRNAQHLQEIRFTCPVCRQDFWGERELSVHMSAKHVNEKHVCETCGVCVRRKSDLVRHQLTHKAKARRCTYCDKSFIRTDHLRVHERRHTKNNPYVCQDCGENYPQKRQLKLHQSKCQANKKAVLTHQV